MTLQNLHAPQDLKLLEHFSSSSPKQPKQKLQVIFLHHLRPKSYLLTFPIQFLLLDLNALLRLSNLNISPNFIIKYCNFHHSILAAKYLLNLNLILKIFVLIILRFKYYFLNYQLNQNYFLVFFLSIFHQDISEIFKLN